MTWFKIDDNFFFHPKVVQAGNSAIGLFVRCGSWASNHLTDGFIPDKVIEMFGSDADITRLVEVGLLEETDDGYLMPAFLDYNPSADEVKAARAASAERQRQSRGRRSDDAEDVTSDSHVSHSDVTRDSHVTASDVTRDSRVSHSAPTRPDPYIKPPPRKPVDNSGGSVVARQVVVVVSDRIMEAEPPSVAPKKRKAYLAALQRRLLNDHADIEQLVQAHGIGGAATIIFRREVDEPAPEPAAPSGPQHDPGCTECAGTGWRSLDELTVDRCDCTSTLAPVIELARTS